MEDDEITAKRKQILLYGKYRALKRPSWLGCGTGEWQGRISAYGAGGDDGIAVDWCREDGLACQMLYDGSSKSDLDTVMTLVRARSVVSKTGLSPRVFGVGFGAA